MAGRQNEGTVGRKQFWNAPCGSRIRQRKPQASQCFPPTSGEVSVSTGGDVAGGGSEECIMPYVKGHVQMLQLSWLREVDRSASLAVANQWPIGHPSAGYMCWCLVVAANNTVHRKSCSANETCSTKQSCPRHGNCQHPGSFTWLASRAICFCNCFKTSNQA